MADTGANSAGVTFLERLKSFCKTQKGFILVAEIVLSLIVIICNAASWFGSYIALAISEMVIAVIFFIVFMMELDKQIKVVNWLWSDLIRAAVSAAVYIITSLICLNTWWRDDALTAGGVFGLIAGLVFAYDTFTIIHQIQSSRPNTAVATDGRV